MKMQYLSYRVIIFIVLTLHESGLVLSQECTSPDLTDEDWKWGLPLLRRNTTYSGTLAEYRMENTVAIHSTLNDGFSYDYIQARLEDNILIIFTTAEFENYEYRETSKQIQIQIVFNCTTGDRQVVFAQDFNLYNNHIPVFSQTTYEITVKLPLHKGFDLAYYQEVLAKDFDLSNNEVTFESPYSGIIDVRTSPRTNEDKKTFYAELILNQQLLTLVEPFNFTIIATDSDTVNPYSGVALVVITSDEEITFVPIPRFEKIIYRGSIDNNNVLTIDDPTIELDSYSPNITYTLSGDDSDLFEFEADILSVKVSLKAPLTKENVAGKTILTATISANHPEVVNGSTVLLIDLPNVAEPTTPKPVFEKSLIKGSINSDLELYVEPIVLAEVSYTPNTTFSMIGDDASIFLLNNELNNLSIELKEPISEAELEDKDFYSFIVVATDPMSGTAEAVVLISVPKKICEECPIGTGCPECPTPAPPLVDPTPKFQNQFYTFTIKSNELGKIGDVLATSLHPDATIQYSIGTENGYLMTRIMIDSSTGEISLSEELNSGNYEAAVYARTIINDEELDTTSAIKLTVVPITTCADGNVTISKTLAILYLKENEIHTNIFPTKLEDCHYVVRSFEPSDKEYVKINTSTNMLESISFDREDIIFDDYDVPQIQVKLKLNCGEPVTPVLFNQSRQISLANSTKIQLPRSITPAVVGGRWYTLTNDIDFTSDSTVINIIIEDVNDNSPIFDPITPTQIGYPESELANHIIPSCLAVIHATDRDIGMNAMIKYTLADNNYFKINPKSGVISPLSDGLSNNVNNVQLTIYATDNNGAENGLSSSHMLLVKRLEDKHLTVVTLRDNDINSVEDVIQQLNSESLTKLLVLHAAIVPYRSAVTKQLRVDLFSALKMIVYSFGSDGEPLLTSQVQRALEPFMISRQLTFSSYEDTLAASDTINDNNIVWMIVVSVLAAVILLAAVGIFMMWWIKIRPYEYKTMIDEVGASQENVHDDFRNYEIESSAESDIAKDKRESVTISGSTELESSDDVGKTAKSLLDILENEDPLENTIVEENEKRERRKSQGVTFNELVERIDIETDPVRDS